MALPAEYISSAPGATGNVWVCQLATGKAYALTEFGGRSAGLSSQGVFSPDSRRLIWTEHVGDPANSTQARIMVHDFDTQTTSTLVEEMPLTNYCGVITSPPSLIWSEAGIVAEYKVLDG